MKACKNGSFCETPEEATLEASGYCFPCAEDLACLLADAREEFGDSPALDPRRAWRG